jgi:putative PIN family toxin of toxin-antitoxin system
MLVVLDTNVLVSGLLNGSGSPGKILDLALEDRFRIAYDDRIFGEYEDVLVRPELHLKPSRVEAVLAYFELSGVLIDTHPLPPMGYADPDDLPFAEVFISSGADALVSGNLRHFTPLLEQGLAVYSPKKFLESYFPGSTTI